MKRFFPAILTLSLVFSLVGLVPPQPARAQSPIAPGTWTGYFTRDITITNTVSGVLIQAFGKAQADLALLVDSSGGITGTISNYQASFQWTVTPAMLGVGGSCTYSGGWDVTSGTVVENPAYLPAFDLQLALTSSNEVCDPPPTGSSPPPANTSAHFEGLNAASGKITGEKFRFADDQVEKMMSNMAQVGAQMNVQEYWELNYSGASVSLLPPNFEQYFLVGVPFQSTYNAAVDWHNNPPGTVDFSLAGQAPLQIDQASNGAEWSAVYQLGSLPAGKNPLIATAIGADGQPSGSATQDVIIVPLEVWAQKAGFKAAETKQDGTQNVVIYRGKTSVPPPPAKIELPYLDLSSIPVIGGKWGVPPIHVDVDLQANSGGGLSEASPVTGQAGLYLGGKAPAMNMEVNGEAYTELTESALLFDHGQVNFKMDPVSFDHQIGLLSLIPEAIALYEIPVLGDMLKAANTILGVKLELTAQAKGKADLGTAADQSQLIFSKGDITPSVEFTAQPGVGIPSFLYLGLSGSGKGEFMIQIAPNPGLQNCLVSLQFTAHVVAIPFVNEHYKSPAYQIAQCQQAAWDGKPVLAVYLPPEISAQMRAAAQQGTLVRASWVPDAPVQAARLSELTSRPAAVYPEAVQSGAGTVLVSAAPPESQLDLALGPQGRMAFVYSTGFEGETALRLFDGQAWGESIPLGEAGRISTSPSAAFDAKGQVVVAWVQPKLSGTPATGEMETFARSFEIVTAVVDSRGELVDQGSLTQDDLLDFAPQLARSADGSVWLAWLQSPAVSLWGPKDNPNWLQVARWDGASWGSPETVSKEIVGALGFRLAAGGSSSVAVAASLDGDGDPETAVDREIYVFERSSSGWTGAQRITDDTEMDIFPLAAYAPEGQLVLAWQRGEEVVGLDKSQPGTVETLSLANPGQIPDLAGGELLAGPQGELAVLWAAFSAAGQAVWLAQRPASGASWQAPSVLVDGLEGVGVLSAQAAQDGSVWVGLAQLQVPSSQQELAGFGEVSMKDLPASADLAVVEAPDVMQPRSEPGPGLEPQTGNNPSGDSSPDLPASSSNSSRLVLVAAVSLIFLLVVGGGILLLSRRRARRRS